MQDKKRINQAAAGFYESDKQDSWKKGAGVKRQQVCVFRRIFAGEIYMGIKLYDNYEEDGQLSMFEAQEQTDGLTEREPETGSGTDIRIRSCSSCGKLLAVREEGNAFFSECNNCGIRYCQKK